MRASHGRRLPALRIVCFVGAAALAACLDDRIAGPRDAGLGRLPALPASHVGSPDELEMPFGSRDATYGKVETGPGPRLKYATVYEVTVYDHATQSKTIPDAPYGAADPLPLNATVSWARTGYSYSQSFISSDAGPVSHYIAFSSGDTITKASTAGGSQPNLSGTKPDSTPFWCGPAYPAHGLCYTYTGSPGSVTFRRLEADIELTADSTVISAGSVVTFRLKAVPETVEGQAMPISIDTVAWIIDPDTLGGDWMDAATTGACTFTTTPVNNKTCTRTIKSAGTLRVVGAVNGKPFVKTQHISRHDAFPIVTPTKYFVSAGQRDTFTVRMSDGSAFTMSLWSWAADSGTGQTSTCSWENPCNNAIIRESGNMRARVIHAGRYKYSQAHVTVGQRPRLQLLADQASAIPGTIVHFTTSAGSAPYAIANWAYNVEGYQYSPDCDPTARECSATIPDAGVMKVWGVVDGFPDSASVEVGLLGSCELAPYLAAAAQPYGVSSRRSPSRRSAGAPAAALCMEGAPWSGGTPTEQCGDQRDTIIAQYYDTTLFRTPDFMTTQQGRNWKPRCASFTQADSTVYFKWAELTRNNPYTWAVLQPALLADTALGYGLDKWRVEYGDTMVTTSVYRSPWRNANLSGGGRGARGSRHMFGDAADIDNPSRLEADWQLLRDAAGRAGAFYREPKDGPCKLNCSHADWRNHFNPDSA